jgi:hypothetical protein
MEQQCDKKLADQKKEVQDQFAQNLKDLTQKLEVINGKKVQEVETSLNSQC